MCISTPMQNLTCKEVPSVTSAPSPCLRGVLSAPGAGLRPYVHEHDRCHREPADGSGHCPPSGRGSRLRGGSRLPLRGAGPFREVTGSRYGAPASVVCMESTRLPFLRHSSSLGREPHCPGVASRRHRPTRTLSAAVKSDAEASLPSPSPALFLPLPRQESQRQPGLWGAPRRPSRRRLQRDGQEGPGSARGRGQRAARLPHGEAVAFRGPRTPHFRGPSNVGKIKM